MIVEREPEKESIVEKSDPIKEKRKKRYTEVTKDLVVREAIERAGYDYDETDHDFCIYEYLRYVWLWFHSFRVVGRIRLTVITNRTMWRDWSK